MEEIIKELGMTVLYMVPVLLLVMLWFYMLQANGALNEIIISYLYGLNG